MKQTKLPKGKKKNCVIYTNLKQNKRVCTSYVCDECGFLGLLRHFITLKSVLKKHTKRKKILDFFQQFSNIQKIVAANQFKPGFQLGSQRAGNPGQLGSRTQLTNPAYEPSLAGFIKTNIQKAMFQFSWVCWVCCQSKKILRAWFTQVTKVQKPSLPCLAGLIKTLKAGFQLGLLDSLPKQQNPESWVHWVLEPSFGFIKTNKKLGFSQKTKWRSCNF